MIHCQYMYICNYIQYVPVKCTRIKNVPGDVYTIHNYVQYVTEFVPNDVHTLHNYIQN